MNLTDLTTELEARADSGKSVPGTTSAADRLSGVRHRIRVRRRRQVSAAVALTAAGVAAIVLVPGLSGLSATPRPTPARVVPVPSPVPDPLVFAADVTGDPLIAHEVGAPGQRELVLRFTPADTDLAVSDFCRLPGVTTPETGRAEITADTTVNGHRLTGDDCTEDGGTGSQMTFNSNDPAANRAAWADLGVRPGRESVIRTVVDPSAARNTAQLRLGIGVYALSGERERSGGVAIKANAEADGHRYRLADHRTAPATATARRLTLQVPSTQHPVMLTFGVEQAAENVTTDLNATLYVDGERAGGIGGGVESGLVLDDAAAHTVELRLDPGLSGTMVLAYYLRTD